MATFHSLLRLFGSCTLLVFLLFSQARAQTGSPPGNGGTTGGPPSPTEAPLDGGAALLLAGGVAYGLRRLRRAGRPKPA